MIKKISAFLGSLCLLVILIPSSLTAAELGVGLSSWYTYWDYDYVTDSGDEDFSMDIDPGFMFGPAFSVKFSDKFSVTSLVLYGAFTADSDYGASIEMSRLDLDTVINYSVNGYIKIFVGGKYITYDYIEENQGEESFEMEQNSYGPGVGISFVYPVADSVYLLGNFSYMYLFGKNIYSGGEDDITATGFTLSLAAAYALKEAPVTISLGGRYQQQTSIYTPDGSTDEIEEMSTFYGITLSAVYTFSFGDDKEDEEEIR
jgi:hypothetical protein